VSDVELADGRLYDLVDTSVLTLLVSDGGTDVADAARPWSDAVVVRHVDLPAEVVDGEGWLLVRPDGYLAAAGRADDGARLSSWLRRWLV
jgi:hypothetical protein